MPRRSGQLTLDLPCTQAADATGWTRLAPLGYDDEASQFVDDLKKSPDYLSIPGEVMGRVRPVLFFAPGQSAIAISRGGPLWWETTAHPPATTP